MCQCIFLWLNGTALSLTRFFYPKLSGLQKSRRPRSVRSKMRPPSQIASVRNGFDRQRNRNAQETQTSQHCSGEDPFNKSNFNLFFLLDKNYNIEYVQLTFIESSCFNFVYYFQMEDFAWDSNFIYIIMGEKINFDLEHYFRMNIFRKKKRDCKEQSFRNIFMLKT